MPNRHALMFNPPTIVRWLGAITLFLALANVVLQIAKYRFGYPYVMGLVPLFDLDGERNLPSFYSTLLLIGASAGLALIAALAHREGSPLASKWAVLAAGFLFMSFDEAFSVHEALSVPVRTLLGGAHAHLGVFYFAWVVPALALVGALGVYFLGFLRDLPPTSRWRFVLAATVYLGGAVGMELINGRYAEAHGLANLTYNLMTTVEEIAEMAGVIYFIGALLRHCAAEYGEVHFDFTPAQLFDASRPTSDGIRIVHNASTWSLTAQSGGARAERRKKAKLHALREEP